MAPLSFAISLFLGLATAQTPGEFARSPPKAPAWKCTNNGGCVPQSSAVVLDDLAHPIHQRIDSLGCGSSAPPNATVCPDAATCVKNCIVEGISDYAAYGLTTSECSLNLHQLVNGVLVFPRAYLLQPNGAKYEMLKLTGNSFCLMSTSRSCLAV
jgi:cellulase